MFENFFKLALQLKQQKPKEFVSQHRLLFTCLRMTCKRRMTLNDLHLLDELIWTFIWFTITRTQLASKCYERDEEDQKCCFKKKVLAPTFVVVFACFAHKPIRLYGLHYSNMLQGDIIVG